MDESTISYLWVEYIYYCYWCGKSGLIANHCAYEYTEDWILPQTFEHTPHTHTYRYLYNLCMNQELKCREMHLWTIFWCISNDNEGVCSKVLLFVWPTDCCIENEAFVRMGSHLDTHRDSRANFVLFFFLISWEFLICLFGRWRYIFCSRGISSNLHSREIAILVLLVFPVIAKKKLTIGSDNHYNIVWWKTDWYRIIHCHWLNTMCIWSWLDVQ